MNRRYKWPAIAMHWLVAVIIFAAFPVGLVMTGMVVSPTKLQLYSYHKWAGVTVFLLACTRIGWRMFDAVPALPQTMSRWEQAMANAMHIVLYLMIAAVPISGWLMSSAAGFQTVYFGVLPIPDLLGKDKALAAGLSAVHETLAYALAGLVLLHAAAALKHHLVDRDDVLTRMLPGLNGGGRR